MRCIVALGLVAALACGCVSIPDTGDVTVAADDLRDLQLFTAPVPGLDRNNSDLLTGSISGNTVVQTGTVEADADPAAIAMELVELAATDGVQWMHYRCTPVFHLTGGVYRNPAVASVDIDVSPAERTVSIRVGSSPTSPGSYVAPLPGTDSSCPATLVAVAVTSGRGG